jgi:gamma-glutamylaminecyclotransferase
MKLFTYGTLMRGYHNNHLLSKCQFIGEAVTLDGFVLYNCGFPMAVPHTDDEDAFPLLSVQGEVWEVDEESLSRIDRLEGHPRWYIRKQRAVVIGEEVCNVHMYVMPQTSTNSLSPIKDNIYKWG